MHYLTAMLNIRLTTYSTDNSESHRCSPVFRQSFLVPHRVIGSMCTLTLLLTQIRKIQPLPPLMPVMPDPTRFFPVKVLFDSVGYRAACESVEREFLPKIDEFQARIKETLLPVQILRTNDRATVANVFERINHQGVPLDTLQLLTAWTWSGDFDLRRRFEDLRDALDEHGFADVGEDTSLILRCCAAIITGSPRTSKLMELNGSLVREIRTS